MPSLSSPLGLSLVASSGSRRLSNTTCSFLPWWKPAAGGSFGQSSFNKLAGQIWRTTAVFSLAREVTAAVDKEKGVDAYLEFADRTRAHHQWCFRRGYGARAAGQQPALVPPLILQAEGRPDVFLPACRPTGRQASFRSESRAWTCCGGHTEASGFVPVAGVARSARELLGTRLQFTFYGWGPLWKSAGLVCMFLPLLGLHVKWQLLLFYDQ